MMRAIPFFLALIGALAVAFAASLPPAARPVDADLRLFSAGRAMVDVRSIAAAPHPTGSVESASVRRHLTRRLEGLGLEVTNQVFPLSAEGRARLETWSVRPPGEVRGVNLVGLLPGRDHNQPAIALMAHYDTVAGSPGAADDSAGVAAILEIIRVLRLSPRERDLVVVLTDAEELDLDGAKAFFGAHPLAKQVGVAVNLEARGGGGRAVMFETAPGAGGLMSLFRDAVDRPGAHSLAVTVYRLMPNSSDLTVALGHGVQGFNFAFMGDAGQYHSPLATPAALSPGSLQHMGDQVLDLTQALLAAKTLPAKAPDPVFSDLLGLVLILYPPWAGWIVVGVSAALLVFGAVRMAGAGTLSLIGVLAGSGRALGLTLFAGAMLYLANQLSGAGAGAEYFDRLAALGRLEAQAVCFGAAALILGLGLRRPAAERRSPWLGGLVTALAGVSALQVTAPPATPPFAWPVLAACLSFSLWSRRPNWLVLAVAVLAGGQALAMAHLAFLGVGPDMPEAMAVFVLIMALLTWPLAGAVRPRQAAVVALALILAGTALALWVRFDPPAPGRPIWLQAQEPRPAPSG